MSEETHWYEVAPGRFEGITRLILLTACLHHDLNPNIEFRNAVDGETTDGNTVTWPVIEAYTTYAMSEALKATYSTVQALAYDLRFKKAVRERTL